MFGTFGKSSATRVVALSAMALGVGAGSYGVASAASGSGSTSAATLSAVSTPSQAQVAAAKPGNAPSGTPWGHQRSDETLLTGDTASKVQAAAVAKVGSGATVVRVETDADGHAAYEVHMTKADGTPITVYVDKSFAVVSVESR
jgi:hypothetical protein